MGLENRLSRRDAIKAAGLAAAAGVAMSAWRNASAPVVMASSRAAATEITVGWYGGSTASNNHAQGLLDAFNKDQSKVHASLNIEPSQNYFTKLVTTVAAGGGPDVTITDLDWTIPGAARGMFVDLTPYMKKSKVTQSEYWYPFAADWGYKGKVYAGFYGAGADAVYINKTLMKAAGLKMPDASWTWNDLITYGKKLTDASKNQWGIYMPSIVPPDSGLGFIVAAGGTVINKAGTKCTLGEKKAMEGLQFIHDLIFKYQIMAKPTAFGTQPDPFGAGKIGIQFAGTWNAPTVEQDAKFDWDFVPHPLNPTTKRAAVPVATNGWGILSTSKNKQAAWEFVNWFQGKRGQEALGTLALPVLTSVFKSKSFLSNYKPQHFGVVVDDAVEWRTSYEGNTPNTTAYWNALSNQLQPGFTGDKSLQAAVSATVQAVNQALSQPVSGAN